MGFNKFQPGCCCGCCQCLDGNPPKCDDGNDAICNPSGLWTCNDNSNPKCAIDASNPTCSGCGCCSGCQTPKQWKVHFGPGWFTDGTCPCGTLLNDQDHFLNHIDFGAPSPGGDPSTDGCTWSKDIDAGDCVPGGGHEHLITEFGFDGCHGGGTAVTAPQGQYGGLVVDCCKPFSALVSIFNPSGPTCTINSVTINTLKTCFTPLPPCPCSSCCYEPLPHTLRVTWTPAGFLIDGANGTCGSKDTNCDTNIPTTFYLIPVAPDGDGYCKWQYTGGGYTVTSKMFNSLDGTCTGGNIDPYCDPATGLTHGVDAPASCVALTTITGPCFNLIYCGQGNCCQGVGGTLTGGTQTCCDEALDAGCSKPNFITLNWFP